MARPRIFPLAEPRNCPVCNILFRPLSANDRKGHGIYCSHKCKGIAKSSIPIKERIWTKVDKNGPIPSHKPELGPCYMWLGGKTEKGYAKIKF